MCGTCGLVFETRQQLEAHERSTHPAEQQEKETGSGKGMQSDLEGMDSGGRMRS
jgi:hypothetical protein